MGAEVELPPQRRRTTAQQAFLITFVVLTSPLWIGFFLLMFGLALAITGISLMIDMMFLFPIVGVIHYFLRLAAQ